MRTTLTLCLAVLAAVSADRPASGQSLLEKLKAESVETLAENAQEMGDPVRGAILFTQPNLSCTQCHQATVGNPIGPDLTRMPQDVTPVHLVESLLHPSKQIRQGFETSVVIMLDGTVYSGRIVGRSSGQVLLQVTAPALRQISLPEAEIDEVETSELSTMPETLVDQLQNRDEFLDLVSYLMELAHASRSSAAARFQAGGGVVREQLQGLALIKNLHCAACHANDLVQTSLTDNTAPDLTTAAARIDLRYLEQWLMDPRRLKPGTTMPDVLGHLTDDERAVAARELTHFLASLSPPEQNQPSEELSSGEESSERGRELFHTVGCVACHSPRDDAGGELLAESSVPLGALDQKYHLAGLVRFLEDPLLIRPAGRMPSMGLTHWEAVDLALYLLDSDAEQNEAAFVVNPELAERGKERFDQLGCRQCHTLGTARPAPKSLALSKVDPTRGCLSRESGAWPAFDLTKAQRDAMQVALTQKSERLSASDQIDLTLTALRCVNCHQRDDLGGVSVERNPHFQTADQNLGPQGRLPPTLTGVGAKLQAGWLRQVLVSGRAIRPYVLTRMPRYGTANVEHLVELFQQTDQLPPVEAAEFEDLKVMREAGAELVGTQGLNCIVCHTFQLKKSANMSAVDLTEMAERLQKDWFDHYMRDPQRLSQNTIMPSFWPGGRAMRTDILEGDADLQIEALWQYLLEGRQARTPRGLIQEPIELLAKGDEAVMLRRSYPGIGKRGIGVGYPRQVNLAFDAEQMRLAMIWKGKFADPGGVWRSQGHGVVRPLGEPLIRFAEGPDLDDAENPWIVDDGRPPEHRFKGYSLDEKMRPRFKYQLGNVLAEDYIQDTIDRSTGTACFERMITLHPGPVRRQLEFRAATGTEIVAAETQVFVVDNQLRVIIDPGHRGKITRDGEVTKLSIPLTIDRDTDTLTIKYVW